LCRHLEQHALYAQTLATRDLASGGEKQNKVKLLRQPLLEHSRSADPRPNRFLDLNIVWVFFLGEVTSGAVVAEGQHQKGWFAPSTVARPRGAAHPHQIPHKGTFSVTFDTASERGPSKILEVGALLRTEQCSRQE
jgi:hypothetical protein